MEIGLQISPQSFEDPDEYIVCQLGFIIQKCIVDNTQQVYYDG